MMAVPMLVAAAAVVGHDRLLVGRESHDLSTSRDGIVTAFAVSRIIVIFSALLLRPFHFLGARARAPPSPRTRKKNAPALASAWGA